MLYTLDGVLYTLDGVLYTLDGVLYTLDGELYTLDGELYTLDGELYTHVAGAGGASDAAARPSAQGAASSYVGSSKNLMNLKGRPKAHRPLYHYSDQ